MRPWSLEDLFVLKEAALRDEQLHVVVDGKHHQLPVNDVEDFALHGYDEVTVVPIAHLVVECVCSWVLDLQILGGNQKANE